MGVVGAAGPCAFQPFPETTTYFGDHTKRWMVNFRVRNIDRMAAQLRAAGITVEIDPKLYPNGRFARLSDPERPVYLHSECDQQKPARV